MTNLLCLLLGCLLPVLALGLMVRRGFRPVAAAAAYRNLAWKLRLDVDMRGRGVRGEVDGRSLFIGLADPARSTGPVTAVLDLTMPLGVGLRVRPRGMANRIRRRAPGSRSELSMRDADLDAAFEVTALEPATADALWTEPVREALARLRAQFKDVVIDDSTIRVTSPTPITVEKRLQALIDDLKLLADALHTAREPAPLPAALADVVPSWAALADAHGLALSPHRPAMAGALHGRAFHATCGRGEGGFAACLRVTWREHRPTGLVLRPQRATDTPGSAGQDILLGDPRFDDALVVKGYDPAAIRALLHGRAQAALTTLATFGKLSMTDRSLQISGLPTDAAALVPVLEQLNELGDALAW